MEGERRKEPSLKELVSLPIVSWYEVGLRLGVKQFELKRIQSTHANRPDFHARCRSDMFQTWLDNHPNPTYNDVRTALINCREKEAVQEVNAKIEQVPSGSPYGTKSCVMVTGVVSFLLASVVFGIVAKTSDYNLLGRTTTSVGGTSTVGHLPASTPMTADVQTPPLNSEKHVPDTNAKRRTEDELERLIMTPGEIGPEVVEACIRKMTDSDIFELPDDNGLMRRIAYVMSRDGKSMKSDGGIWQITEFGFKDTKEDSAHYRLPSKWSRINRAFGIDWPAVKRRDLDKPFIPL